MFSRLISKRNLPPTSKTFILNLLFFSLLLAFLTLLLSISHPPSSHHPPTPPLLPDRSFLTLSVDDFGRWTDSVPLFPDISFMNNHSNLIIQNDFWYRRATVETNHDLISLKQRLETLNSQVSMEQKAVLTPHWIVGGPDFGAMRAAGCGNTHTVENKLPIHTASPSSTTSLQLSFVGPLLQHAQLDTPHLADQQAQVLSDITRLVAVDNDPGPRFENCVYKEQLLSDAGPTGLDQKPYHRGDLRASYKALWKAGLWHPEYHGRSHFSVAKWLKLLKTDRKTQMCFHNNLVCATDTTMLRSEFNGFGDKTELKTWLEEGINAFSSFWGYRPALISSPHNTWNSWLTDVAVDLSFIGAELAEDQANYVHGDGLSLHDRYRFDVFFPGFQCDKAIEEVIQLLHVPADKTWSDRWYEFLSMIDLFRVHHRPYHHGIGGDHERFISLMWHAQNAMSSTYTAPEHTKHMQCLEKAIHLIRKQNPRAVFVTGSELHQIRARGWSMEVWSDSITLRNYGTHGVDVTVPDLRELYAQSVSWRGKDVYATIVSANGVDLDLLGDTEKGNSTLLDTVVARELPNDVERRRKVEVGQVVRVESDYVVKLTSS